MSTIYSHLMTCAADQKWGGQACEDCPTGQFSTGQFSAGGTATSTSCTTCNANEIWNGQACEACPDGSYSAGGDATTTLCTTCALNEYWNWTACQAMTFHHVSPSSSSATVTTTSKYQFSHAVKAPHKNVVYFVPKNIDVIGKLDVESETFSELQFTSLTGSTQNYEGGTVVGSKIYMTPMHKNHIGVFDTETKEYSTIAVYASSDPKNMANGPPASIGTKLYICPNMAGNVMAVIDTTTDTASLITLDTIPTYSSRRFAGSFAVGDKVICVPYGRFDTGIGIYDTTTQTWTRRSITDVVPDQASNGHYMYQNGCVAGDVVYFAGDRRAGVGKYNVTADDFYEIAVDQAAASFTGCAVLNGKAYFPPSKGRSILVVDVATDAYETIAVSGVEDIQAINANYRSFGVGAIALNNFIMPPFGNDEIGFLKIGFTCATDEYWNGTSCAACAEGSFSAGGNATSCENLYTYSFTITVQGASASVTNGDHLHTLSVKLDGVLPTEDQFTIHVMPDRAACAEGSCTTGQIGFTDNDINSLSAWYPSGTQPGTKIFSITSRTRVSVIEITYNRPMQAPGWLIEVDDVEKIRETMNHGDASVPNPVTYTYDVS